MRKVNEYKIKKKAWRGFSEMEKVIASSIDNFLIGLKCLLVGNAPSNPIDLGGGVYASGHKRFPWRSYHRRAPIR